MALYYKYGILLSLISYRLSFKDLYGSKGFNSEFFLYKELFDITLSTSGNRIEVYLNTIKRLTNELKSKSIIIPNKLVFAWVLNNLGSQYETLVTIIT